MGEETHEGHMSLFKFLFGTNEKRETGEERETFFLYFQICPFFLSAFILFKTPLSLSSFSPKRRRTIPENGIGIGPNRSAPGVSPELRP